MEHSGDIEKKYRHAILVLQAIAQRTGEAKIPGSNDKYCDEWTVAEAFDDCVEAATRALKYLGEQTIMPNKAAKIKRKEMGR